MTLLDTLRDARQRKVAVGHFNVAELTAVQAVVAAARTLAVPVIIGASEGEREFLGVAQIAALVRSLRERGDVTLFLDADHTHSLEKAEEAARAGFDQIVFDASALPFDENVAATRRAVTAVKSIAPGIVVEGEIGFIGSSSSVHSEAAAPAYPLTDPEQARQFVDATGIDVLAPSVGTTHGMRPGMLDGRETKPIDAARIAAIRAATDRPLTLHGSSGIADDDLRRAVTAGITLVHFNTELRVAWRRGLDAVLAAQPREVVPYKLLPGVVDAIRTVVEHRLRVASLLQ